MADSLPALNAREFSVISELMADISGIKMQPHKQALVAGRLMKRLRALSLDEFSEYITVLENPVNQEERRIAVDLLTTNETFFFREQPHFDLITKLVRQYPRRPLHIWSAACSSGEEVYSLAMVISANIASGTHWQVIGSDLCRQVLDTANKAVYPLERSENIPADWLRKFCLKGVGNMSGAFCIRKELAQHTQFKCLNLNENLPDTHGPFDIIFLRNMLIYFDKPAKQIILSRVLRKLKKGGLIFVGHSEGLHDLDLPIEPYATAVYRKIG